ncbi:MAG: hypothetical protein J6Z29_06305 [Ruminococcus sp.]|nr:hypothetical protein [Ruminococcus sp.]
MRKMTAFAAAAVMAATLASCGKNVCDDIYVSSEKYLGDELVTTMHNMEKTLDAQDKVPDRIKYFGDDVCNEDMIEKLKEEGVLEEDSKAVECIGYEVDYHYSKNIITMLKSNFDSGEFDTEKHEGAQYWFAREKDGEWECVSSEEPIL